ncbi:MAG: hypothetical protein JNM00_05745, partial [Flavobacteriales bacterium]|nr:hypothetical protein [Flavobacteriales bacterium]
MNQKIITGLLILLPVGWISAQATDLNTTTPEKPRQDYREWYTRLHQEFFPEGKPAVKGYKQFERANMEWEYHIDEEGKMPNYGQLNYDAYLQLKNTTAPSGATWDFVGPHGPDLDNDFTTGGTGRVNCIQVWDADTWFIGASGGGLWMTDNSGIYLPGIVDQPWKNLTVNMPILAISGIAVNPNDDNEIYILTGDPFNQELPSMGIFHTTDQGENWEQASLTFSRDELEYGYKLLFNPQNFQEMYAATSDGLFHTTDGWQTHSTELSQDVYDVEFKPGDPSVVYASSADKVFRLCCGSAQFSETDAGQNENNPRRCEIAVTAAAPEWVYAVFIDQDQSMGGLYLSTDSGDGWSGESNGDFNICASEDPEDPEDKGQGAYCVAFYVSNDIPTHLWYGCVNLWASVAGGANDSWFQLTDWDSDDDVHADWHDLVYNSYTGEFIAATDGGVYASSDLGANWSNRCHGLHITEYYHIGVDNNILFTTNVAGGAQDNGTIMSMAIEGTSEDEKIQGGDGFEVYLNGYSEYGTEVYSESQHGKLYFAGYQDGLPYSGTIYPSAVEEGIENKTNRFNTPYAVSPVDWGTVIIGYEDLYYSANSGQDWFVSWDNSDYIDTQVESEIVAIDFTGGATAGFVVHLIDGNELVSSRVYTTNFLSNTILVDNGWQQFSTGSFGIPEERNISDLSFRYDEEGSDYFFRLAICLAGYDAENKVIYIADVLNHPDSVINLTYDMPNIPVRCVEQHEDGFYAGTDIGVFFLGNESTSWVYYNSGLPVVPVNEIEIKETMLEGEMLYIATYGRGIWRNFLADKQPVRRYVDADASGNNDGTSWENAFTDLNSALSVANPADSLWIAEGIYTPINNRDASFNINGERLYGGFDGTETQLSERDPSQHVTKLSGDIGVDGVDTDNVYRLLMLNESTNHCWFDGITFSDGYANGPSAGQKTGACIRLETMLDCEQCDPYVDKRPHFSNCRFENFYAEDYGGVLYLFDPTKVHYQGTDPVPDLPIIFENCVFLNNIADYGGA